MEDTQQQGQIRVTMTEEYKIFLANLKRLPSVWQYRSFSDFVKDAFYHYFEMSLKGNPKNKRGGVNE